MKLWLVVVCLLAGCDVLWNLGTVDPPPPPDAPLPPGNWAQISVGARHACGIDSAKHLSCWGDAHDNATTFTTPWTTPQAVGDLEWTAIAAGGFHTCGISNGHAFCWGLDTEGQVNGMAGTTIAAPTSVPFPVGTQDIVQIATGAVHSCAITNDGKLFCWGATQFIGQNTGVAELGAGVVWKLLAAGVDHTCAIDGAGAVWCWGYNGYGELGGPDSAVPQQVNGLPGPVSQISVGFATSCALLGSGELWCWGNAANFGLSQPGNIEPPTKIIDGSDWLAVTAGNDSQCALRAGNWTCWGQTNYGGNGDGVWSEALPATGASHLIPGETLALSRSNELDESACVISNGNLSCWGDNRGGIQGTPATLHTTGVVVAPVMAAWSALWEGADHVCANDDQGNTYCWGDDDDGQVSGTTCAHAPCSQATPLPLNASVHELVAGIAYTCTHRTATTVVECRGTNAHGELGSPGAIVTSSLTTPGITKLTGGPYATCALDGTGEKCWGDIAGTNGVATPTAPTVNGAPLGMFTDVTFGRYAQCGIIGSSTAHQCWGYGFWKILGDGMDHTDVALRSYTEDVGAEGAYLAISSFGSNVCGINKDVNMGGGDADIKCWGKNDFGESYPLDNSYRDPTLLLAKDGTELESCTSIATSTRFACATCNTTTYCWGSNADGRLGRGDDFHQNLQPDPVQLPSGHPWLQVAAGNVHACALSNDGTLACWGLGIHGQFGDGGHGSSLPVAIAAPP